MEEEEEVCVEVHPHYSRAHALKHLYEGSTKSVNAATGGLNLLTYADVCSR